MDIEVPRRTFLSLLSTPGVARLTIEDVQAELDVDANRYSERACGFKGPLRHRPTAKPNCSYLYVDADNNDVYATYLNESAWTKIADGIKPKTSPSITPLPSDQRIHYYVAEDQNLNDGDTGSTWTDNEDNDDLSAANSPIYKTDVKNGKAAWEMNNTDNYFNQGSPSETPTQPLTLYAVAQPDSNTDHDVIHDAPNTNDRIFLNAAQDQKWGVFAGNNTAEGNNYSGGDWYVIQVRIKNSNGWLNVNDTDNISGVNVGGNDINSVRVGADANTSRFFGGFIAEIIHYDKFHDNTTNGDGEQAIKHLQEKYNI